MDVRTAVETRRSCSRLGDPAPTEEQFLNLLRIAARAPDHGQRYAWRFVQVRGQARQRLDEVFRAALGPDSRAGKALRAPLLSTIVLCPDPHAGIPEWEQLAAVCGVVSNLALLLHEEGFGSMWRTGELARNELVARTLAIAPTERLLGWLYIGTPERAHSGTRPDVPCTVASKVSQFGTAAELVV